MQLISFRLTKANIKDYILKHSVQDLLVAVAEVSSGCDGLESSPSRKSSREKCPGPF